MGKKRRAGSAKDSGFGANKELERLLLQILDVTTRIPDPKEEWDHYMSVHSLIENVRKLERGKEPPCFGVLRDRKASLDMFMCWLSSNGVDTQKVCLEDFGDMGFGLSAAAHIQIADKILSIPRQIMMLSNAPSSALGAFLKSDPIASKMPNVALALHVLYEMTRRDSFWKPYLDMLPAEYTTPLYFSPKELSLLRGSPCLSECIGLARNIARQYAYFHRLLGSDEMSPAALPLQGRFTYDGYRWAVSTVMTRQNSIPCGGPRDTSLGDCSALIPLWDMCNHAPGEMATDYNVELNACQSYATTDISPGQQIFICYGQRSNKEFFVHSGFVPRDNPYDKLLVKLGFSKADLLFTQRSALLERLGLMSSQSYELQSGEQPVTAPLLAFLRTFCASADELEKLLTLTTGELVELLTCSHVHITKENSMKVCSFLACRIELLLRAYQPSPCQTAGEATLHQLLAASLVTEEKKILERTLNYCRNELACLQSVAKE